MAFIECLQCFSVQFLYTIEHIVAIIIDCGRMTSAGRRIMMIDGACAATFIVPVPFVCCFTHTGYGARKNNNNKWIPGMRQWNSIQNLLHSGFLGRIYSVIDIRGIGQLPFQQQNRSTWPTMIVARRTCQMSGSARKKHHMHVAAVVGRWRDIGRAYNRDKLNQLLTRQ